MDSSEQSTVTKLLMDLQAGKTGSLDALFDNVYEALRQLAHAQRHTWDSDYTLNTTALVHEAYLKLVDQSKSEMTSRAHFLNVAAKVMRHLLIDYARQRRAQKRGGKYQIGSLEDIHASLEEELVLTEDRAETLLALDEALKKLELIDERESRVVECRFFSGMSIQETAEVLGVSPMTVKRDWKMALAWLKREMSDPSA